MYIGELNTRLENVNISYCDMNTGMPVSVKENGDPLKNEALIFNWSLSGVRVSVSFIGKFFVERLTLTLGENSSPKRIALYNSEGVLISEHLGETGKAISEKEIHLLINERTNDFYFEIDSNFNDIEIKGMSLYGAEITDVSLFPVPQRVVEYGKSVPLTNFNGIKCENDLLVSILNEKLNEKAGITLTKSENGNVVFRHDSSVKGHSFYFDIVEV